MPLISALRRQRQVDLCEFKASLVYKATQRSPVLKTGKREKRKGGAGKMAQQLRVSAALQRVLNLVPSTHIKHLTTASDSNSMGSDTLF